MRALTAACLIAGLIASVPQGAAAQTAAPADASPAGAVTGGERVEWVVRGNASPQSLAAGVFVAGWDTAVNVPDEWRREWSGFGKRYLDREAHIAVSNGLEAALGAAWREDPRYFRSSANRLGDRTMHALRSAFIARRGAHDGPAWARYAATVGSALVENSWLPPSATTGGMTTWRIGSAYIGRAVGNLWAEFWPDVRDRLSR
jgi:hypothetical protein